MSFVKEYSNYFINILKNNYKKFFHTLYNIFDNLLVAHVTGNQYRSILKSSLLTLIIIFIGISLNWNLVKVQDIVFSRHPHSTISLEIAINRILCGKISHIMEGFPITELVSNNPKVLHQEVMSLPSQIAGSDNDYCKNDSIQFLNNENSIMLMEQAILMIFPNITLRELGFTLNLIRVLSLIIFVFFLILIGASPLLTLVVFMLGISIPVQVQNAYYSNYPFLMPLTLMTISLWGICLITGVHRKIWSIMLAGGALGFFGAFFGNLRSSYYPVILVLLCVYVVFTILDLRYNSNFSRVRRALLTIFLFISFIMGLTLFHTLYIRPLNEMGVTYNRSHHFVTHNILMGVAVPENELSKREEIKWDDGSGWELARRIDPSVTYLGPNYGKAQFVYYIKLWVYNPLEMLNIYKNKMKMAGHSVAWGAPTTLTNYNSINNYNTLILQRKVLLTILMPMLLLPNGIFFLVIFLVIALVGLIGFKYLNLGCAYGLTALAMSGVLLFMESAIVIPGFDLNYQSYNLFWILFCGLLFYQLCCNLLPHVIKYSISIFRKYKPF